MTTRSLIRGASAAFLFACPIGPRIPLRNEDGTGADAIIERLDETHTETKTLFGQVDKQIGDLGARLTDLEQHSARSRHGGGGGGAQDRTIGEQLVESPEFKALIAAGGRGSARVEVKAITSIAASGGSLIAPERVEAVGLPQREMTIRKLLAPGRTISNLIYYPRQTTRTTNASPVAENPSAPKPESVIAWEQAQAPVKTIAHTMVASKQVLADAPALVSLIDSEMQYGLRDKEEVQLLLGDGTGENINGIMPQATAFSAPFAVTGATKLDILLQALAQAELALLPATGIVLNTLDWHAILALKDSQGRYIGGGPFAAIEDRIWSIPRVTTPIMPAGSFLVGAFANGAQIFDRLDAEVLISTEDRDNFVKNMVTILAEERLALAVKRPAAFVKGTFPTS